MTSYRDMSALYRALVAAGMPHDRGNPNRVRDTWRAAQEILGVYGSPRGSPLKGRGHPGSISERARQAGITLSALFCRINKGMTHEEAFAAGPRMGRTRKLCGHYNKVPGERRLRREAAKAVSQPIFLSPTPCKHCGGVVFYTSSGACQPCSTQRSIRRSAAHYIPAAAKRGLRARSECAHHVTG